jgi:hypothetical protein
VAGAPAAATTGSKVTTDNKSSDIKKDSKDNKTVGHDGKAVDSKVTAKPTTAPAAAPSRTN